MNGRAGRARLSLQNRALKSLKTESFPASGGLTASPRSQTPVASRGASARTPRAHRQRQYYSTVYPTTYRCPLSPTPLCLFLATKPYVPFPCGEVFVLVTTMASGVYCEACIPFGAPRV